MTMHRFLEQLIPTFHERHTEKSIRLRLKAKQNKIKRGESLEETWKHFRALDVAALKEALKSELDRREAFQRRGLGFLGIVAVMSAFVLGAVSLLRYPRHEIPSAVTISLIFLTLGYLAYAAWSALKIIAPGQLYDLSLQNRMPGEEPLEEEAWKDVIIEVVELNQVSNLLLAFGSERSYRSLRNGLACLVASLVAVVVDAALRILS